MININIKHKANLSWQEQLAVKITNSVGTMTCVILFCGIGIGSLVGVVTNNTFLALLFGAVSSYFLQLVLLPLLMLGQNLQQRHAEMREEERYRLAIKNEKETEEIQKQLLELLSIGHTILDMIKQTNLSIHGENTSKKDVEKFEAWLKKQYE